MTLSPQTISKIADALKPEIISCIYEHEKYRQFMQEMITYGIDAKMGEMDDELLFDLSFLISERIKLN